MSNLKESDEKLVDEVAMTIWKERGQASLQLLKGDIRAAISRVRQLATAKPSERQWVQIHQEDVSRMEAAIEARDLLIKVIVDFLPDEWMRRNLLTTQPLLVEILMKPRSDEGSTK